MARVFRKSAFMEQDRTNAQMRGKKRRAANVMPDALSLLQNAVKRYGMSMRAYTRLIKVARTIADLASEEAVGLAAMAEAVQYRMLDGKYWGDRHA